MSVAPRMSIVAEPRAIGRPTQDDLEERTLAGRIAHLAEGHLFGVSVECVYGTGNIAASRSHDAAADAAVERIDRLAARLLDHDLSRAEVHALARAIRRECAAYRISDTAEDAEVGQAAYRIVAAHDHARIGAGEVEHAIAGRCRGREAVAPRTPAVQMPWPLDGEGL